MPDRAMKKKRKRRFYEILAAICEVPGEVVGKIPVFLMRGREELEITGARSIREYSRERIVLWMGDGLFTVVGNNLELTDFEEAVLYVRGEIGCLYFEGENVC